MSFWRFKALETGVGLCVGLAMIPVVWLLAILLAPVYRLGNAALYRGFCNRTALHRCHCHGREHNYCKT